MSSAGVSGHDFSLVISMTPTERTRLLARLVPGSYDYIWRDLARCVSLPSVSGSELHSLQEQMVCHVFYGVTGGGATFDFEGWRPDVSANAALNPFNKCDWRPAQSVVDGYEGALVHWAADTSSQRTAWLIVRSGGILHREYIPSADLYNCLKSQGHAGPFDLAGGFMHTYMTDDLRTPSCTSAPPPTTPPSPSHPTFQVMNTSETLPDGVWFRNSPHTADTSRITGLGVYAGEYVQLQCYGWGDVVGPYNDSLWYYVTNVSRPTVGSLTNAGWLSAHYINDGLLANQVDAGVAAC